MPVMPRPPLPFAAAAVQVNIPKVAPNPKDFELIASALQELSLSEEYLKLFKRENVTDADLLLLTDTDLTALFVSLGPRMRFRAWLQRNMSKLRRAHDKDTKTVDESEYRMIREILNRLQIADAAQIVANFMSLGVNDKMVKHLLHCNDELKELIPDMSARIRFRGYLAAQQPTRSPLQTQMIAPPTSSVQANIAGNAQSQFLY